MKRLIAIALVAAPPMSGSAAPVPANPLVGAWHLVRIDEPGADGKIIHHNDLKGSLIYTPTGRLSVQVMYPDDALTNDYVKSGYEASFGSYTVDTKAHQVIHHVEGANVGALIGRDLPRAYRLSGKQLTISSTRPDEHWAVIWERF
jgi:hypothetical protein